jgi:hypothetical protein
MWKDMDWIDAAWDREKWRDVIIRLLEVQVQ